MLTPSKVVIMHMMHTLLPLQQIYFGLQEVHGGKTLSGSRGYGRRAWSTVTTTVRCPYKHWLMCMIQWNTRVSLLKWVVIRKKLRCHQTSLKSLWQTIWCGWPTSRQIPTRSFIKELMDGRFPKCKTSFLFREDAQAGEIQGQHTPGQGKRWTGQCRVF